MLWPGSCWGDFHSVLLWVSFAPFDTSVDASRFLLSNADGSVVTVLLDVFVGC